MADAQMESRREIMAFTAGVGTGIEVALAIHGLANGVLVVGGNENEGGSQNTPTDRRIAGPMENVATCKS